MKLITLPLIALAFLGFSSLQAHNFNGIVAFGDSLTDNGNACLYAKNPSYICLAYPHGRFTDGPVWLEVLSKKMSFAAPTPSLIGGNNFAFGGATTGFARSPHLLNVGHQIKAYLERNKGVADSKKLVVIWAGGNDVKNEIVPVKLIANMKQHIEDLANAGAKTFLVPNFAPYAQTPLASSAISAVAEAVGTVWDFFRVTFNETSETDGKTIQEGISSITGHLTDGGIRILNMLLEQMLVSVESSKNVKIYRFDAYNNFLKAKAEHDEADLFTYDLFHPSAFAHRRMAQDIEKVLNTKSHTQKQTRS